MRSRRARGQALAVLVIVLFPLAAAALAVGTVARLVADQTRLQAAVDAAAYSGAALQAEALNHLAVANRTLAANLATTGQMVSIVGHLRALARAARAARAAGVVFPALAPAVGLAGQGFEAAASGAATAARFVVPAAAAASALTVARGRLALASADLRLASRVEARLRAAAPGARLTARSAAALRSAPLSRAVRGGRPVAVIQVARASADRFTAGKSGTPPLGRTWSLARIGKHGTTRLDDAGSVEARDSVGVELPRGARFGVTVRVDAREFGHRGVQGGFALADGRPPSALLVEATLTSVGGRRLAARAAAAAVYRRPGRPEERPDLFGPFWRPRLVPYAAATGRDGRSGAAR